MAEPACSATNSASFRMRSRGQRDEKVKTCNSSTDTRGMQTNMDTVRQTWVGLRMPLENDKELETAQIMLNFADMGERNGGMPRRSCGSGAAG